MRSAKSDMINGAFLRGYGAIMAHFRKSRHIVAQFKAASVVAAKLPDHFLRTQSGHASANYGLARIPYSWASIDNLPNFLGAELVRHIVY